MGWKATEKAIQAADRRQQREAQRRLRELEREAREKAKLSAIEQARLEVETYNNSLEVLLTLHKERVSIGDWMELAAALPPHRPAKFSVHELKAKQRGELQSIDGARAQDKQDFEEALKAHEAELVEWDRIKNIARQVLRGESNAYTQALVEFSGLAELSQLGSSLHFTVHSRKLVECVLKANGQHIIPTELKTLTSTGKLSVKAMPKARFHEIYQDYICSCVLRVAREVLALLPIDAVLVTAVVEGVDLRTGHMAEQPVLSVLMPRTQLESLDLTQIDPSDAMQNFIHRGDAKASRKSGEFERIAPLTPAELPAATAVSADYRDLLNAVQRTRREIISEIGVREPDDATNNLTVTAIKPA